jgi:hypothetical protein
MPPPNNIDAAFIASNSLDVNIDDDEEPYGIAELLILMMTAPFHL